MGRSGRRLRQGLDAPRDEVLERPHQQPSPDRRQATLESRGGFVSRNRHPFLRQDRPGVDAGIHLHDGDAGLGIAAENRPLDRGGTPMPR